MRHPLFDELEAFHPRWMDLYDTLEEAAKAAGVHAMWIDWCNGCGRHTAGCSRVPNHRAAIKRLQQQARTGSLPYRLDTFGRMARWEQGR